MSRQQKFRITLWAINTTAGSTGGWRGDQKAVVYDAKSIGIEEFANDTGSAYWTLPNDHPQLAEFVPLERHYEISRWSDSRSRWEFAGAGILDDYTATETETVFAGIDYKAVLNQGFTPLTNLTFDTTTPFNPDYKTNDIDSIFKFADTGTVGEKSKATAAPYGDMNATGGVVDAIHGAIYTYATPTGSTTVNLEGNIAIDHVNYDKDTNKNIKITAFSYEVIGSTTATAKKVSVSVPPTTSIISVSGVPAVKLQFSAICYNASTSVSTRWDTAVEFRFRINASPPGPKDIGDPPTSTSYCAAEFSVIDDKTYNNTNTKFYCSDVVVYLYSYETRKKLIALGASSSTAVNRNPIVNVGGFLAGSDGDTRRIDHFSLRDGVTYSLSVYAAVCRPGYQRDFASGEPNFYYPKWLINANSETTAEFTLGQRTDNAATIITDAFTSQTVDTASRIRSSTITVSGTTATTHTTFTAGQPVLDYIADVCDLEMGARTDGGKAIFGILKPSNGSTYSGNFQLRLNVASTAVSGIALRYPENIKSYSFAPGYSRVRNDVTVIPTTQYLSGSTAQTGNSIVGATASDTASISRFGRIPLVATKSGFVNAQAATNEANRLIRLYGNLDASNKPKNTKNISLRVMVDNLELWDGWDVGDSINVIIQHGNVNVNEPFVISGVRWFGESNGVELIEFELVQGSSFATSFSQGSAGSNSGGGKGKP